MSTPSRNCSSPKRTTSGTTLTPSAFASEGEISAVLSVTRWITSLEGEHVWIVLLTPVVQLEFGALMGAVEGFDQRRGVAGTHVLAAVHGDQLGRGGLRGEHGLDDLEITVADLGDLVVDDRDDVADLDVVPVDIAVAHRVGHLDGAHRRNRRQHPLAVVIDIRLGIEREQRADALREV